MGSVANIWILGGYQSDFARNFTREGHDFADLTAEVVDQTLAVAKVDAADVEVVHVANAFGEMFARQGRPAVILTHTACGQRFNAVLACDQCARPLTGEQIAVTWQ